MKFIVKIIPFFIVISQLAGSVAMADDSLVSDKTWIPENGVYMSVEELKFGVPSYQIHQLYKSRHDDNFSIKKWSRTTRMLVINGVGKRISLRDSVFCVMEDGDMRVCRGGRFHTVYEFGRVCYFRESYPMVKDQMSPVVTETYGTAEYFLLDLESGMILDYSLNSVESLIKSDVELLKEFRSIRKLKKRKSLMYLYIEKYNSRNPLPIIT